MKDDKNNRVLNITFVLILAILFGIYCFSLIMLHFNQTLYTETGLYESDLFAHIEMAPDGIVGVGVAVGKLRVESRYK